MTSADEAGVLNINISEYADHFGPVSLPRCRIEGLQETGIKQALVCCHTCVSAALAHAALMADATNARNGSNADAVVAQIFGFPIWI